MASSRGSHLAGGSDGNKKREVPVSERRAVRRESVAEKSQVREPVQENDAAAAEKIPVNDAKKKKKRHVLGKVLLVILALCVAFGVLGLGTVLLVVNGPSEQAKMLFVRTFIDTGTLQWVPRMFMSQQEVVRLANPKITAGAKMYTVEKDAAVTEVVIEPVPEDVPVIELVDISGPSWHGKMLIVRDPSLVRLAIPEKQEENGSYGLDQLMPVEGFCEMYGAVAGITAGGFNMETGRPSGFIIKNGKVVVSNDNESRAACGFTKDHVLVVNVMTEEEALERGIVEGLCWQPILIYDGIKQVNMGGGYNPRAAIGQRPDGTVLLVMIEGRMISSLGASYDDLVEFFEEQGCINAINLDSGRSSVMVYEGEPITKIAVGAGIQTTSRFAPNAFVVMPEGWTDD